MGVDLVFKVRQLVWFWLGLWFFESGARDIPPKSEGKQFIFSYYPGTFARVYFGTKAVGNVKYELTCLRNCGDKLPPKEGTFKFPAFESLQFPVCKEQTGLSGRQLPVLEVRASSAVYVSLIITQSTDSIACTYLLPVQVAGRHYFYLTPYQYGRMMIFSLDYTKTCVKVFLKDNVEYKTDRPLNTTSLPNNGLKREQNDPEFWFQNQLPESMKVRVGVWTDISLQRFECYYLEVINAHSDLSGAQITSDYPILILQGANEQAGFPNTERSEIFMDALAPVETFGTFYAVPFCSGEAGEVKVVTSGGGEVSIQIGSVVTVLVLWQASDWVDFAVGNLTGPVFVMSMRPINVLQTILSSDQAEDEVSCMRSVDPIERWSKSYSWINPQSVGGEIFIHFTTIMIESGHDYEQNVIVNSEVPQVNWETRLCKLGTEKNYSFARLTVGPGSYEVYIRNHPAVPILVTLYSFIEKAGYCTAPSAVFPKINVPSGNCNTTDTEPGDLLDNDCDGRFDEEKRNNEDDDGDERIDEDLQPAARVNGRWGPWSGFECVGSCGRTNGISMRIRKCDNPPTSGSGDPCMGDNEILQEPPECVLDYVKCPSECRAKEWGYNCSKTCSTCVEECSTEFGTCEKCVEGYASVFCNESCPEYCKACNMTSRTCVSCEKGLLGPRCDEACPKTFFGEACTLKCNFLCKNEDCDGKSGDCFQCPDGRWGTDCSKSCLNDCRACWKHNGKCEQPSSNGTTILLIFALVLAVLVSVIGIVVGYGRRLDTSQILEEKHDAEGGTLYTVEEGETEAGDDEEESERAEEKETQLGEEKASPRGEEKASPPGEEKASQLGEERASPLGEEKASPPGEEKESQRGEEKESQRGEEKESQRGDGGQPQREEGETSQGKKPEEGQGVDKGEKKKDDTEQASQKKVEKEGSDTKAQASSVKNSR